MRNCDLLFPGPYCVAIHKTNMASLLWLFIVYIVILGAHAQKVRCNRQKGVQGPRVLGVKSDFLDVNCLTEGGRV